MVFRCILVELIFWGKRETVFETYKITVPDSFYVLHYLIISNK